MAISVESSSPASLTKGSPSLMNSPPVISPSSEKRFWSALRCRVDTLLENRKPVDLSFPAQTTGGGGRDERTKRMKEDAMLLLRGFDSVSYSLSQLSNNLENALQGARDLAKPPTLTEILHCTMEKAKTGENQSKEGKDEGDKEKEESEEGYRGLKRKLDSQESSEVPQEDDDDTEKENEKVPKELGRFKKAKNLAISMASKASTLAREVKSIRSDLCFVQERCALLEEENRRLRDGFSKGIRPEEDDLVRLQMEALLAEKSRLASENANLTRENQCLRQLSEYHQLASQDLSASYENLLQGMGLEISCTPEDEDHTDANDGSGKRQRDIYGVSKSLDDIFDEE